MNRRDLISTAGAASATLLATAVVARAEDKASGDHDHQVAGHEHHHPAKYKALSETAAKCVLDGENNMRHCLAMVAMKDTSMAECLKLTYDTIAACRALEALAAVNSPYTGAIAKVVDQVCTACKKECDKFPQYEECRAMSEACNACAAECRKV